jgi:RimJ/RimL family protein N-acetyltransferase
MSDFRIRSFVPEEWALFRDFRLAALAAAPGVYLGSVAESSTRSDEEWRAMLADPRHRIFALFDGETLIGITAAFTHREEPQTALLAMSFILPAYRKAGLSRLLYEARLDWIRSAGRFRRVIVSHRASNEASRRANQHFGFVPIGRNSIAWPDGTTEDEINYELVLRP